MLKYWYYHTFKNYARRKGFQILWDDYKFIERMINNLPEIEQRSLMREYLMQWAAGLVGHNNAAQNQNLGRYRANVYLREYVTKRIR
jgi:hypothetical protein